MDVQKITGKLGALNLLHQYVRETNVKNKESVMSALSSYLRGINTDGKREFLSEAYSGMAFLKAALTQSLGQVRLAKKIMMLLQDFVNNDSLILFKGNPNRIKLTILEDPSFLKCLVDHLHESSGALDDYQMHDLRLSILNIMEHLSTYKPSVLATDLSNPLEELRQAI